MTGLPVIIVESGGLPVSQVEAGAPVMTVAQNGLGIPITLVDNAAPFIVQGTEPPVTPAAFSAGDWSLEPTSTEGQLKVTIINLPDDRGSEITDIEYRVTSGAWTSSGGVTDFDIDGLDPILTRVWLRAVSAEGNGGIGPYKEATPAGAPSQDFWRSATLTAGDASTGDDEWQMVEMTVETIDG